MFKLCFYHGSVLFVSLQFIRDTPWQPQQMLVQTTSYCLHAAFFLEDKYSSYFVTALVLVLVWSFRSALFLVWWVANPILRVLTHCHLSTLMCLMIYLKHMLLRSIWGGSKSFNFDRVVSLSWHFLLLFLCTKFIKRFLPLFT